MPSHIVETPQGVVKARALLALRYFSLSVLLNHSHLRRLTQDARICCIVAIPYSNGKQAVTQFLISSVHSDGMRYNLNAFIVPQITGDQPVCNVSPAQNWNHLDGLVLADPEYNKPGKINLLLGVGIFVEDIRHGRQPGPHDTPTALDIAFGSVLAGSAGAQLTQRLSCHTLLQ